VVLSPCHRIPGVGNFTGALAKRLLSALVRAPECHFREKFVQLHQNSATRRCQFGCQHKASRVFRPQLAEILCNGELYFRQVVHLRPAATTIPETDAGPQSLTL
jgi:hypothetical protein